MTISGFGVKIPSVLFALLVMLLTCLFHFRSLDIVTPRYLAESVIGKGWSWKVSWPGPWPRLWLCHCSGSALVP